jgi:hypothetical protein
MNKYVLLSCGFETPTPETTKAWMDWFGSVGEHIVDSGNPFRIGREVTRTGSTELPRDATSITGYCIVNAESIDEAEKLLEGCPIIHSMRIYEAASM